MRRCASCRQRVELTVGDFKLVPREAEMAILAAIDIVAKAVDTTTAIVRLNELVLVLKEPTQ